MSKLTTGLSLVVLNFYLSSQSIWSTLRLGLILYLSFTLIDYYNRLRTLPGPKSTSWLFGNQYQILRSACGRGGVWVEWGKKYGGAYRVWGNFNEPWLIISDPRAASHVLSTNAENYPRTSGVKEILTVAFGKGSVLTVDGEEHKRRRKSMAPAFSASTIHKIHGVFLDLASQLKDEWASALVSEKEVEIDVLSSLHKITLDAISLTTFSYKISTSPSPPIRHFFSPSPPPTNNTTSSPLKKKKFFSPKPLFFAALLDNFPVIARVPNAHRKMWGRLREALGPVAEGVWEREGMGGERKEEGRRYATLLEALGEYSREDAISQMISILFSGSETTANMTSECLYHLAHHPSVQTRLRSELLGGWSYEATEKEREKFPYFDAVIKEIQRVGAPLTKIQRVAARDDVIPLGTESKIGNEITVKAGQIVHVLVRDGINISSPVWGEDGNVFRPERWLDGDGQGVGDMLTFGDGPMGCPGRLFALAELKIYIATIIQAFEVLPPSSGEGLEIDFYFRSGTTKPYIRGREDEGPRMPLRLRML